MSVSRSVTERRARRLARKNGPVDPTLTPGGASFLVPSGGIPHEAITDPPSPGASDEMAAGGENIVRGNSNLQPLNALGHQTASKVGADLAALGGPDEIIPASSTRAQETGQDVAAQTGAPVQPPVQGLESHALGQLEGEPRTPQVKRYLSSLIKSDPNQKIPGQGALSSRPGESFNQFRTRALGAIKALMQKLASSPSSRVLVPTSTQVIKLVQGWCAAGCPDDGSIDHRPMLAEDSGKPGEIERLFPDAEGRWELSPFSPKSAHEFPPGIYLMRHGETDSVQAIHASEGQRARAQIISHVRNGDYHSARKVGMDARGKGILGDQEISDSIDEALPGAQDAGRLLPSELLAAASAAGPGKRAELLPALRERFGDLSQVSQEGQHPLRSHLGRLGV